MKIPNTLPAVKSSDLLPPCPRIIDPVNPVNNVYLSGVGRNEREGEGKWDPFKRKVSSFDITCTAIKIMKGM